ncbi:MAG TPA: AsmA family protein [Candidatus Edwardsbacteria bacterium]|nr:AsmA family protein [Candidatus Edwardsbacteria bacterium]
MPKFLKTALIVIAAVIVLLVAAGVALKLLFPPAKLRAILMPRIEQAVGRPVKVGEFSLKVFTGLGVRLTDIELANATGFDPRPMATVRAVTLKVNLLALLRGQLAVSSLVIDQPSILIEKDLKGVFNFADLIKPAAPAPAAPAATPGAVPVSFAVQSFRINDGRFEFNDRQGRLRAVAAGIDEQLSLDADRKLEHIRTTGDITVHGIDVEMGALKLTRLFVSVHHDVAVNLPGKQVTINQLTVAPQGIALTLAGTVTQFDTKPVLDLALQTTAIDMRQAFAAIPREFKAQAKDVQATGRIELGLKITGQIDPADPKSKPKIDGFVNLRDIGVKYAMLPKAVSGINGEIAFTEDLLDVKSLTAKLGSAGIALSCLVQHFEDPDVRAAFQGKLDLAEVKDYAPLEPGTTLAGAIDADFKAAGRVKDPNSFTMDGKVLLKGLTITTPALLKPVTDLSGTVTLTKNLINVPDISCKIGRSSISFNAQVKNFLSLVPEQPAAKGKPAMALPKQGKAQITFALTSPLLDLDEMLPPIQPQGQKAKGQKGGEAAAKPQQMLPLPDMLAGGTVKIAKIKFLKMDFDNLAGNLKLADRKVDLDGAVNVYSGKVTGTVWADLNDISRIEYRLNASASQLEANDFLSALTPFKDRLFTKLDVKGEFSGLAPDTILVKKSLKGQGSAKSGEGKLVNYQVLADVLAFCKLGDTKEVSFRSLSMGFRIADEKVYLDDLQMTSKFGDVSLSGNSSFTGYLDYKATIKLTKEESDKMKGKAGNAAALFTDKDGRVVLDLLVKGQSPKPGVSWDTQMAQSRLKGKAQEEIDRAKQQAEDKAKKEAADAAKKAGEKLKNLFKH